MARFGLDFETLHAQQPISSCSVRACKADGPYREYAGYGGQGPPLRTALRHGLARRSSCGSKGAIRTRLRRVRHRGTRGRTRAPRPHGVVNISTSRNRSKSSILAPRYWTSNRVTLLPWQSLHVHARRVFHVRTDRWIAIAVESNEQFRRCNVVGSRCARWRSANVSGRRARQTKWTHDSNVARQDCFAAMYLLQRRVPPVGARPSDYWSIPTGIQWTFCPRPSRLARVL